MKAEQQIQQAAKIGELTANQRYAEEIMRDLLAENPDISHWLKMRVDAWLKCVEQPEQQDQEAA